MYKMWKSISTVLQCLNFINTYQLCSYSTDIIYDLSHHNLTSIPGNIPPDVRILDLSFNNITAIRNRDLERLNHLVCLCLSFNPISQIEDEAFMGLDNLQTLEINDHYLDYEAFNADVFLPIQNLQNLSLRTDLAVNNHKQVAVQILKHFINITTLILDTGSETDFDFNFKNLRKIKQLVIGRLELDVKTFECGLEFFNNHTFRGLSDLGVEVLDLTHCNALNIEDGFLKPLINLKTFLFPSGVFPVQGGFPDLIRSLRFYKNKSMTAIDLSNPHTGEQIVQEGSAIVTMEILGNICLEKLVLSNCKINMLNFINILFQIRSGHVTFPPFGRCIRHFDVSYNHITGEFLKPQLFFISFLENLEYLDLTGQFIFQRRYDSTFTTQFTRHESSSSPDIIFFMPKKLTHFNIGGGMYRIGHLLNIDFKNGQNLRYMNVSLTGLFDFNRILTGIENVEILDFSGNDVSVINITFFDYFPNVTHLRLAECFLDGDFILSHGRRLFQPMAKLEILDLSRNNLIKLPRDIFQTHDQLKIINLAFNKLFSHPDFLYNPNLQVLYLNFNNFIKFSSQEMEMFDKMEADQANRTHLELHIFGNTLACTCETYDFISWLNSTTIKLDRRNYTCIDLKSDLIITEDFKKINYIQFCLSSLWLNISISVAATISVVTVTLFVVVKNKLIVKIFIQRLLGKYVYPQRRQDFKYDAYIIYPDCLYQMVCFDMVQIIEKTSSLKFYIPHRDQLYGVCKVDDITESCKNSWKLVLILTQEFMNESLAYFTLSSCLTSITLTTPHRLILIIDSSLSLLPNIEFFLQSVSESNVIYADLNQSLSEEFWTKLRDNIISQDLN